MNVEAFLTLAVKWARRTPSISALGLVGSYARDAANPESDVDLVTLCSDPESLAESNDWIHQFGRVREVRREQYGIVIGLQAFYQEGLQVEFGLNPRYWADLPLDPGTRRVISDGMRILYDPRGILEAAHKAAIHGSRR